MANFEDLATKNDHKLVFDGNGGVAVEAVLRGLPGLGEPLPAPAAGIQAQNVRKGLI